MKFLSHIKAFVLCVFLFGVQQVSFAQSNFTYSYTQDKFLIGEQVQVMYQLKTKGTLNIWGTFADSLRNIEIVDSSKIDSVVGGTENIYSKTYTITSFDTGSVVLPGLQVSVNNGAAIENLNTSPITFFVSTVTVDTTQAIYDIKDIIHVDDTQIMDKIVHYIKNYWPFIIGIIILISIAIFVVVYFIKNKTPKSGSRKAKELPHETALRMIGELESQQLWQKGNYKEFHSQLSDITRNYLEARFNIHILEQTTQQVLKQAKDNKDLRKVRQELQTILRTADLVKFAKGNPSVDENMQAVQLAKSIVLKTKPEEEIKEDNHDQ